MHRSAKLRRIWTVLRWTLLAVAALFVLFVGYLVYEDATLGRRLDSSAFVHELRRLEAEQRYGELTTTLYNRAASVDEDESKVIVKWIESRLGNGNGPYFYLAGLYAAKRVNRFNVLKVLEYFSTGRLVYRADALRCNDPTAYQGLRILESTLFGPFFARISELPQAHRDYLIKRALRKEEQLKSRPVAKWICAHGIGSASKKRPHLSYDEWQAARQRARDRFITYMKRETR